MASTAIRGFRVMADAVRLLVLVLIVPVAILAIGTPIALLVAGLLWLVRAAL